MLLKKTLGKSLCDYDPMRREFYLNDGTVITDEEACYLGLQVERAPIGAMDYTMADDLGEFVQQKLDFVKSKEKNFSGRKNR